MNQRKSSRIEQAERIRKKKELINTEVIPRRKDKKEKKIKECSPDTTNLKIIPIRPEESARRKDLKELHPNLPDIYKGQLIALLAPIRSSKSTTWNNFLHNENFFKDMFSDVYIIRNTV